MKKVLLISLPFVLFLGVVTVLSQHAVFTSEVTTYVQSTHLLTSYLIYLLITIMAVVFMPFTVLPLIPIVSSILGPFATGVLSAIGWTIGSMIAFLISRYIGAPLLKNFIPLERLDALLQMIPDKSRFLFIVVLRLTLPVDLVSYALGLAKSLSFIEFSAATFIGVLWFSFAFAYIGDALLSGNTLLTVQLVTASLVIFLIGWYLLKRSKKTRDTD